MSSALTLRNAALRLAIREAIDCELTPLHELGTTLSALASGALAGARAVVVLGASTPGLAASLISEGVTQNRAITAIESDATLVHSCLPHAGNAATAASTITVLCSDPMDLRIDPGAADELVVAVKPDNYAAYRALGARIVAQAAAAPLIADESVDLVIVDMLANRLTMYDTGRVLAEAFRVLRRGGRVLLAALLADERLTTEREIDFGLWRATRLPLEIDLAAELGTAGFHGMTYHSVLGRPVRLVQGIELRAFLMDGFKGKQGKCLDQGHAVIYGGPWREVLDDDGHRYARGERAAVCAKTFELLMRAPYHGQFVGLPPYVQIGLDQAPEFDCNTPARRDPDVTKGLLSVLDARNAHVAAMDCGTPSSGSGPPTLCSPERPGSGCCD